MYKLSTFKLFKNQKQKEKEKRNQKEKKERKKEKRIIPLRESVNRTRVRMRGASYSI